MHPKAAQSHSPHAAGILLTILARFVNTSVLISLLFLIITLVCVCFFSAGEGKVRHSHQYSGTISGSVLIYDSSNDQ